MNIVKAAVWVCVRGLNLPSVLWSDRDVTAFTISGTSLQVLEPSQCARQTAPLPDKRQEDNLKLSCPPTQRRPETTEMQGGGLPTCVSHHN